uniref:Putative disease resistance protein n=1 Tax=Noccaea caerulescens TaxID=107243 RepID=A0A1J3DS02_NOCCA
MAPVISQSEADKGDFKLRFQARYNGWLEKSHTTKREEDSEIKYLSTGILKKRVVKEADEDDRVETNSSLPGPKIHGFSNEIKSLKNFLLDQKVYNDFKSLVVVGEYGVGKTALCKTIFNDGDVRSVYAPRIWVSMHSNESKEGLDGKICVLKKILKGLGVEDKMLGSIKTEAEEECRNKQEVGESDGETAKEKELAALLYALHLNLRWKKYLIVFDDVREEDNWNEMLQDDEEKLKKDKKWGKYLSDGFPKGSGGRVIYTTRDEKNNLAKKLVAEEHEIHRLWPLTDSLSVWTIYKEALKENEEEEPPRNDKKCIDELMNKSRGLPLAVRLMATLLPVFLDDEKTDQNDGSNNGAPGSGNNVTPEENTPQPAQED